MRPGFKNSLTQKQLEYVRRHSQFSHYVWFVTCLYPIFVPHRLTRGILETIIGNHFKNIFLGVDFPLIIVIMTQ